MSKPVRFIIALWGLSLCVPWQTAQAEQAGAAASVSSSGAELGQLSDFIAKVLKNSPRARSLEASMQASVARRQAADRPLHNPELALEAERTDVNTRSIGLSQAVDWSGKRRARSEQAGFELKAASARAAVSRQALASELLKALADHGAADQLNQLAQERVRLMGQFAHIADQRRAAGDLDQVEYDLASLAALQAELEAAEFSARLGDARRALQVLAGAAGASQWPSLPDSPHGIQMQQANLDVLLKSHPSYLASQAAVEAARSAVELRQREARPDPTVGLRAGREDSDRLTALTLSVPLFVRNRYKAEVQEANALLEQAGQEARTNWLDLHSRAEVSRQRYLLTRKTWTSWQKRGQTSLQRRTSLLKRLWQAGELSTTDYLVQLKQTLETQGAAVELRGRLWRAWADWLQASGTVFQWLGLKDDFTTIAEQ
ncbi:MAG: TolC family protein [Gammaproteobacteria bacterium]|nr:MAG: TolC family protein [Gammaproteobacteria bacterium]